MIPAAAIRLVSIRAAALALVVAVLTVSLLGCAEPRPPERVFLVTLDTLRADHLGLYGYPRGVSPFLDELGSEGLTFETAFASVAHTAPSHASLFTGLHPPQHRLLRNGETLHEALLTLADVFRGQGYRTAGFTTVRFMKELAAGFDEFHHKKRYHPASTILGDALEWIRSQGEAEKLFVWIHLYDVHQWVNDDHLDDRAQAEVPLPGTPEGEALLSYMRRERGVRYGRDMEKLIDAVDRYDGQLLSADRELERFFRVLEAEGLCESSLWVVTSDHGEGLGNHDYLVHGKTVYHEEIRVPLFFYFSDRRYEPRRIDGLVRLVDVAPTLAESVGASFEDQVIPLAGASLVPLFEDPGHAWNVPAVFSLRRPADEIRLRKGWVPGDVYALHTERYKVIAYSEARTEIYDLEVDPFELEDLARDPPEDHERLLKALSRRYQAMNEQGERLGTGTIDPKHFQELKALGYM